MHEGAGGAADDAAEDVSELGDAVRLQGSEDLAAAPSMRITSQPKKGRAAVLAARPFQMHRVSSVEIQALFYL